MKKSLIVTALFMFSVMAFCQETNNVKKITVDDAVILAADNNINLHRQKLSLDLTEKKNKYSWNGISPSVSLTGSMNYVATSLQV